MTKESKSKRYDVALSEQYTGEFMQTHIEKAARYLGLYISHIGSYSRKKYPNSIHWHFKEKPQEKGCLDATFWEEGNEFWIVARNYEPDWVKQKALDMQEYLQGIL
ncbi:hypothetical protein BKI52_21730 [marine bacterium AO1-C]|nr:hypothetical protein BKI52_21730 [marine bacterium AO1-C]